MLKEARNAVAVESGGKESLVLNRDELIWLVEYERMVDGADFSLTVEQLNDFSAEWKLKVSISKDGKLKVDN